MIFGIHLMIFERLETTYQIPLKNTCHNPINVLKSNLNETKECPFCAEIIKNKAIICRFCNRDLTQNNSITKSD